ncbi:MAG: carbon-nitrogen family hydrolase [Phycisphaerales bacterium]|nr:carbon-nitrogen family hydrolase [Phycisphaerales bacterium]
MHAHLVQFEIAWEDPEANYRHVESLLEQTRPEAGDLVVLPEMFDTGFSFNLEKTVAASTRTIEWLRSVATSRGITIHGSCTLRGEDGRGRNMAMIINQRGDLVGQYAKIHPFSFGKEHEYFTAGTGTLQYRWSYLSVCPAICYDLRFPELFRRGMLQGAEMFVVGANWPGVRAHQWRALLIARAIENQAYVLGVNRVGNDPTVSYLGGSIAVSPKGSILGELGYAEEVLSIEVDSNAVWDWRKAFPAWRDIKMMKL